MNGLEVILAALRERGAKVREVKPGHFMATCLAHDDHTPSLSLTRGANCKPLIRCMAGCDTEAVLKALELTWPMILGDTGQCAPSSNEGTTKTASKTYPDIDSAVRVLVAHDATLTPAGCWTYSDAAAREVFAQLRFDLPERDPDTDKPEKTFRLMRKSETGWNWGKPKGLLPLYRLPDVLARPEEMIVVVEGERAADAAAEIGLLAVTSACGAGKVKLTDWSPLAGRPVVLLPDADEPGEQHMQDVAAGLNALGCEVRIVNLPGLPPKGDIVEYLAGRDAAEPDTLRHEIERMAAAAAIWTPSAEQRIEALKTDPRAALRTDLGNGVRFALKVGVDFRFCGVWGTWLHWDGTRWVRDDALRVEAAAKAVALGIIDEAKAADDVQRPLLLEWAKASQSARKLREMVSMARSELPISPVDLDKDGMLLNVLNGTVDLRTGKLREHRREDYITKLAPVAFDPAATCPLWDSFLHRIMADNRRLIEFLQRLAGLCLTADATEQLLFMFFGVGANGKNVFLDTLTGMLGDYASEAPPDLLIVRRSEEHPTEIADLCGKRLVVASETEEGCKFRVQLLKRLTGNARLKGRYMRQDYFTFDRTHKLILATNNRPRVAEDTVAVWRRLWLVPFNVTIPPEEQDKALTRKLQAEWPGILNSALAGCLAWQRYGLPMPDEVEEATAAYREDQDPLREFLESCCVLVPDAWISRAAVLKAYDEWAKESNERFPLGPRQFYDRLRKRDGIKDEQRRVGEKSPKGFKGIGLRSEVAQ